MDIYKIRPRQDRRGFDLESTVLSHGHLWYQDIFAAIGYAKWNSRVSGAKIEILDGTGTIVRSEMFQAGDFAY